MGLKNSKVLGLFRRSKSKEEATPVDNVPEPEEPLATDPRLPLDARQVFRLQKSWKGIKRKITDAAVELFVRYSFNNWLL